MGQINCTGCKGLKFKIPSIGKDIHCLHSIPRKRGSQSGKGSVHLLTGLAMYPQPSITCSWGYAGQLQASRVRFASGYNIASPIYVDYLLLGAQTGFSWKYFVMSNN